jgi:FkbM family methyltransferase
MLDSAYQILMLSLQEKALELYLLNKSEVQRANITRSLERVLISLLPLISPTVVVEIGAHEASFSKLAKQALPLARIIAMEANPAVFAKFEADIIAHGIEFVNKAAADIDAKIRFSVPENKEHGEIMSMGSLLRTSFTSKSNTFEVDAVRLDSFLGTDCRTRKVLWIDVEGAVGIVLDGASGALESCVAVYAEIEPSDRAWPGQMLDVAVIELLGSYGLVPVLRDVQRKNWQYNVLFLSRDVLTDANVKVQVARYFDCVAGQ